MKYIVNITVTMSREITVQADDPSIAEAIARDKAMFEPIFFVGESPDDTIITEVEETPDEIF